MKKLFFVVSALVCGVNAQGAVSYIAGAVVGRIVKASMKAHDTYQHISPKISADADAWAAK